MHSSSKLIYLDHLCHLLAHDLGSANPDVLGAHTVYLVMKVQPVAVVDVMGGEGTNRIHEGHLSGGWFGGTLDCGVILGLYFLLFGHLGLLS